MPCRRSSEAANWRMRVFNRNVERIDGLRPERAGLGQARGGFENRFNLRLGQPSYR